MTDEQILDKPLIEANTKDLFIGKRLGKYKNLPLFLNLTEIAALIGVRLCTFDKIRAQPDFPKPVKLYPGGRSMWRSEEVIKWARDLVQTDEVNGDEGQDAVQHA